MHQPSGNSFQKEDRGIWATTVVVFTLLVIGLMVASLGAFVSTVESRDSSKVDPQVWQHLITGEDDKVTLKVVLDETDLRNSEELIEAQIVIADLLETLLSTGIIELYRPHYGNNEILIAGTKEAVIFLSELPGVATINLAESSWQELTPHDTVAIQATGQITGLVTGPDGSTPLEGIAVTAFLQVDPVSWPVAGTATTNISGTYAIGGLESGIYRVRFRDPIGNHISEYYNNRLSFSQANAFIVVDGQTTSNINATMEVAGHVTGKVTDPSGKGVKDVGVNALRFDGSRWQIFDGDVTDNKGEFDIGGLISDTYRIQYTDIFLRFVTEYYDNWGTVDDADDVIVNNGQTVTNINAEMGPYGSMNGKVTGPFSQTALEGINVTVYEGNDYAKIVGFTDTDGSGNYLVNGLVTGDYQVEFYDPLGYYSTEFYDNQPDIASATDVAVTLGLETAGIDASLLPPTTTVTNTLVSGWNLISFPVQLENPAVSAALSAITGTYEIIWSFQADTATCDPADAEWKRYDPDINPTFNTLDEITAIHGYWLEMLSPGSLNVDGWQPEQVTIELCPGWNMIGYPSLTSLPVEDALAGIEGKYDVIFQYVAADVGDEWKKYDPNLPFGNTLTTMEYGYGYWIQMNEVATLTFENR